MTYEQIGVVMLPLFKVGVGCFALYGFVVFCIQLYVLATNRR